MLVKAIAWVRGENEASLRHVRLAVNYILPLRLIIVNEVLKCKVPTIDALVQQCIRDFDEWCNKEGRHLVKALNRAFESLRRLDFTETYEALKGYHNDLVLYTLSLDVRARLQRLKEELSALIPKLDEDLRYWRKLGMKIARLGYLYVFTTLVLYM